MRQQRIILLLLLLLASLASCSPGHLGSNVIAFIRDGHLWTIDPNGANAFEVVAYDVPTVGYTWSPNHQLLAFRTLDADFAKTSAAKKLTGHPITGLIQDVPSTANTIGVDGGSPIPIAFSSPDVLYSNAMWNISGTRLLYRQAPKSPPSSPDNVIWWISQNDQPGGIAIKSFPGSYSIPSISYANSNFKAIGNSKHGVFTTTLAGTDLHYILHDPLPGHPLPATLERVLWQPAHQDTHILYAIPVTNSKASNTSILTTQLVLRTLTNGQTTTLATCTCMQFAWSPDGNYLLYSTGSNYTILDLNHNSSFQITNADNGVPYWSPDSQSLLLDGLHTLTLVQIADKQQKILLSDGRISSDTTSATLPATNALLQPVANSVWSDDSRHFLFLTRERLQWQGQPLHSGKGLYTVTLDNSEHPQGMPIRVDTGDDSQPGWTYEDANTSFLY